MEEEYIDCSRCSHWTFELRQKSLCSMCNNSGKRLNPKNMLCNMCGDPLCHDIKTKSGRWHAEDDPCGLINVSVMGGYESYHLFDMTSYQFSMCELCLRKMFNQFVIKPKLSDNDFSGGSVEEAWEQDQEHYEYRVWQDDGGFHEAYLNKKCNVKKDCANGALFTILFNGEYTEECACDLHKDKYGSCGTQYKLTKFIPSDLRAFL